MTLTADALNDSAPLPVDVIERVRERRLVSDDAELEILLLAVEWAVANPVLTGRRRGSCGRPRPG